MLFVNSKPDYKREKFEKSYKKIVDDEEENCGKIIIVIKIFVCMVFFLFFLMVSARVVLHYEMMDKIRNKKKFFVQIH